MGNYPGVNVLLDLAVFCINHFLNYDNYWD